MIERISDTNDMSSAAEEMARIAAAQFRKPEGPAATGECLNCGESLPDGLRWCDADCQHDYIRREAMSA